MSDEEYVLVSRKLLVRVQAIVGAACAAMNTTEGAGVLRKKVYDELCAVLAAKGASTSNDAARYAYILQRAFSSEACDRWEGKMWEFHVHDPRSVGFTNAIDDAMGRR